MLEELVSQYGVCNYIAVLKAGNFRSLGLLSRLGFERGSAEQAIAHGADQDELVMVKASRAAKNVV